MEREGLDGEIYEWEIRRGSRSRMEELERRWRICTEKGTEKSATRGREGRGTRLGDDIVSG